jgi:hypothetical protein
MPWLNSPQREARVGVAGLRHHVRRILAERYEERRERVHSLWGESPSGSGVLPATSLPGDSLRR